MERVATGLWRIDTRMGGCRAVTAAYLAEGSAPALVDTGPRTSLPAVRDALAGHGIAAEDLAWIVLTHIHLDHCGGTGDLAAAFPRARVVVHPRGVRHLAAPERLVAASHAVYGALAPVYGDLAATPAERVLAAAGPIALGGGAALVPIDAPGHARHHLAFLHADTGTLIAGDAAGARFGGADTYPTIPPPELDPAAGLDTLARLRAVRPARVEVSHFGPLAEPDEGLAHAAEQLARVTEAGRAAWHRGSGRDGVATAAAEALPPGPATAGKEAEERWRRFGWLEVNVDGLVSWLARTEGDGARV